LTDYLPKSPSTGSEDAAAATVVLSAADESVRRTLYAALGRTAHSVVAERNTAQRALGAVLVHRPTLCLIDADLPGEVDVTIRSMLETRPGTRIGILAHSVEQPGLLRALRAGADGVLLTVAPPGELASEIEALVRGEQVLPGDLGDHLADAPVTITPRPLREIGEPATSAFGSPEPPPVVEQPVAGTRLPVDHEPPNPPARKQDESELESLPKLRPRQPHVPDTSSGEGQLAGLVRYAPRFARHLRRRIRSDMPLSAALQSTRARMRDYQRPDKSDDH
jgi:two-component system, NarL family, response regulator DesR